MVEWFLKLAMPMKFPKDAKAFSFYLQAMGQKIGFLTFLLRAGLELGELAATASDQVKAILVSGWCDWCFKHFHQQCGIPSGELT